MKYELIHDLPDLKKGAIFQPGGDGIVWLHEDHMNNKLHVYPKSVMEKVEWFRELKGGDNHGR